MKAPRVVPVRMVLDGKQTDKDHLEANKQVDWDQSGENIWDYRIHHNDVEDCQELADVENPEVWNFAAKNPKREHTVAEYPTDSHRMYK